MTPPQVGAVPAPGVLLPSLPRRHAAARDRLYGTYRSTHAGPTSQAGTGLVFRRDIAPYLPADRGAAILDVGCGQGALVAELIHAGYRRARSVSSRPVTNSTV